MTHGFLFQSSWKQLVQSWLPKARRQPLVVGITKIQPLLLLDENMMMTLRGRMMPMSKKNPLLSKIPLEIFFLVSIR